MAKQKEVTILDLLDRIIDKGVVLRGDVTISVAEVDLIYLGLKVLLTSVERAKEMRGAAGQVGVEMADLITVAQPTAKVRREL